MKLAFTLISGLSIILAGYILYNRNSCNNKIRDLETQLSKCRAGACNTCKDYSNEPPLQKLNTNMLRDMAYMYQGNMQNQASLQFNGASKEDAKCIWFDLDSVKHFIWEVETAVCNNKCVTPENKNMKLGLRIYYARYPQAGSGSSRPQLSGLNPDYLNRHTVFMVPTYDKSTTGDLPIDFDPDYYDAGKCVYKEIKISRDDTSLTFPKTINALAGAATQQVGSNSRAMNHGSICPPVCKPPIGTVFIK